MPSYPTTQPVNLSIHCFGKLRASPTHIALARPEAAWPSGAVDQGGRRMPADHWKQKLLHGPDCCHRTLLQGGRGCYRHTGEQQGDPGCDHRFPDHPGPPLPPVGLGFGALMGRGQYPPRWYPQGKTHPAGPAAGPMQGPWWAWKEGDHGGALNGVTLLSYESGLKSPDLNLLPATETCSASNSGSIAAKAAVLRRHPLRRQGRAEIACMR